MTSGFWEQVIDSDLRQGDFLPGINIPFFAPDYGTEDKSYSVPVKECDVIIITQSCDLANGKVNLVATCPVFLLKDFETANPHFRNKGEWERVRMGRIEGLHLLGSFVRPEDSRDSRVVSFREIYSMPPQYLKRHAGQLSKRSRLKSPYLEHYSQAFARFFMRVGLPSTIPPFT